MNDVSFDAVRQVPGIYRRKIAGALITAISDGHLDQQFEQMQGIEESEMVARLKDAHRPARLRISVNAFVIQTASETIMIDAGTGSALGPHAGHVIQNLNAAGIDPRSIGKIVLTHAHVDHANGLIDPNGEKLFPQAAIYVNQQEMAFWFDDDKMARADEIRRRACGFVRSALAPYADQTIPFRWGDEIGGLEALASPGHTPGHTCFRLSGNHENILFWGDIVHVPELQVPRPDITIVFDVDQPLAAQSRLKILDMCASDGVLVAGSHMHFPGFSFIDRSNRGFRFTSEPWISEL